MKLIFNFRVDMCDLYVSAYFVRINLVFYLPALIFQFSISTNEVLSNINSNTHNIYETNIFLLL